MAAVDPYSPCPCGSGQKFKWCCHKVEAHADRAQKLFESGQVDAAVEALDVGLRKEAGNPWLLSRKALFQIRLGRPEEAKATLRLVLQKQPKHIGALVLMTRLALETEGPATGAAHFQQVRAAFPAEGQRDLASLARVVAAFLTEAGKIPAAIVHLKLALDLAGENDAPTSSALRMIEASPNFSAWLKNPYTLAPAPGGLDDAARGRFEQALQWAEQGLWSSAASAFEVLSADARTEGVAERNLGLCRLWTADETGAVAALRRYIARLGTTPEAVDLEALCQQISPPGDDDLVERAQLIWPLRDRERLLKALRADPTVREQEPGPIDPDDPESPEVDQFGLLDRPALERGGTLRVADIPKFVGQVLVGQEIVALETYDDGRLDGLSDRFTTLAGSAIARAHPRTKVVDKVAGSSLALSWEWLLPEGVDEAENARLNREEAARILRDVWPNTPMSYLGGRTPLLAAKAGNAAVPLRAALWQIEQSRQTREQGALTELRATLKIDPEPRIDAGSVDVDALHLARLSLVDVERLGDDQLVALYRRARRWMTSEILERTARVLADRPAVTERAGLEPLALFSDLAVLAAGHDDPAAAFDWVRRGRQAESASSRARNAPVWDMLEVRLRMQTEEPEVWVPELAVVMERYRDDSAAYQVILKTLLDLGLISVAPNPDRPDDFLIDSRPLQALLAEYGPRVTTASGGLGVSASRGEVWTPGGPSGGGGGAIWTPGSQAAPSSPSGEEKPKPRLIIPGR